MKIAKTNPINNQIIVIDLPITNEQIEKHASGVLIQNCMGNLNADQREFYLTGTPPGLYEFQFEKKFWDIIFHNQFRYEFYFSKSLQNFRLYIYDESNNLINFQRINHVLFENHIAILNNYEKDLKIVIDKFNEILLTDDSDVLIPNMQTLFDNQFNIDLYKSIYFEYFKPFFKDAFENINALSFEYWFELNTKQIKNGK